MKAERHLPPASAPPRSARDALRRQLRERWKRYRRELKACQRKFSEGAVHESRVAARRLLAAIELLAGLEMPAGWRHARRVLKRHLRRLAPLRDAQVQLKLAARLPGVWPDAPAFRRFLERRVERAAREAQRFLSELEVESIAAAVGELSRALCRSLEEAGEPADQRRLRATARRAFAQTRWAKDCLDARRAETVHRLRVACKKFRYQAELLAPLWPRFSTRHRAALRRYQGWMGDIQDASVLRQMLADFAGRTKLPPPIRRAAVREVERYRDDLIRRFLRRPDPLERMRPLLETAAA